MTDKKLYTQIMTEAGSDELFVVTTTRHLKIRFPHELYHWAKDQFPFIHGMSIMDQHHGTTVYTVKKSDDALQIVHRTDGLFTQLKNHALVVKGADCVPIIMYHPDLQLIGGLHSGWRGTLDGIITKALRRLTNKYHADLSRLFVGFGPCICGKCFEVGPDVWGKFHERFPEVAVHGKEDYLDLKAVLCHHLAEYNVPAENIFDMGHCTACMPDLYYSFRRENQTKGRMYTVIVLKDLNLQKST